MNSTPDEAKVERLDSGWPPPVLGVTAMIAGAVGYFSVLDLLLPDNSGLLQQTRPYFFLFFWLPAITIYHSRFPTWPAAAMVISMALLAFAVGAISLFLGVLAGPDTVSQIFAGIAAAFVIAIGTIVLSRQRWPDENVSPDSGHANKSRVGLGTLGRIAVLVVFTAGFAYVTAVLFFWVTIDCRCLYLGIWLAGFFPAALIALKRGGGRKEWVITILASLSVYALSVAGIVIGPWAYYAWELRGHLTGTFIVLFGGMVPGVIVFSLLVARSDQIASAAKAEAKA